MTQKIGLRRLFGGRAPEAAAPEPQPVAVPVRAIPGPAGDILVPMHVDLSPDLPDIRGAFDFLRGSVLGGWIIDVRDPEAPVNVTITLAGVDLMVCTPWIDRQDIRELAKGPTKAGFSLDFGFDQLPDLPKALDALRALGPGPVKVQDLLVLRAQGTTLRLPPARGIRAQSRDPVAFADEIAANMRPPDFPGSQSDTRRWISSDTALAPPGTVASSHPDADKIAAFFDPSFYLAGFPADAHPPDPIRHYLDGGWRDWRDPAPWFSGRHYLARYPDVAAADMAPFLHYCIAGRSEGRPLVRLGEEADSDVYRAQALATAPGPLFEEFDPAIGLGREKRAKVLAYYLPQFHPVAVNDENWGKGFTEWRNLPRAMPRFMGHIQPRIPRDLGAYDLAEGDAMRRQIAMARAAGLHGFCFYHYWFDGQRVLERPMERLLADPTLDFPFCLMWANENWTRTWDGAEKEIILRQSYDPQDDMAFVADLARHMADPRYIRIDGRPLLFIYRPGFIPDAADTLARWRRMFRDGHGMDPLIFNAQTFNHDDPRPLQLDGAIEFPPHKVLVHARDLKHRIRLLDGQFTGNIPIYDSVVDAATRDPQPDYPLIRTVFPSWDNDARRPGRSTIVAHSTPAAFERWLDWAITQAEQHPVHGERFVCVNAWNEWAEGAYLEPDVHFGAAYLNSLSRVVHGRPAHLRAAQRRVLLVGHDAMAFGAQMLLHRIGAELVAQSGVAVTFLLAAESWSPGVRGAMMERYRAVGPVHCMAPDAAGLPALLRDLAAEGYDTAICNTSATGAFMPALRQAGLRCLSLVHEMPPLLERALMAPSLVDIARHAEAVVFPAAVVRDGFERLAPPLRGRAILAPQGLYQSGLLAATRGDGGLRAELGLAPDCRIVLGVGYADLRKGIDRFVTSALTICAADPSVAFVWVGAPAGETSWWYAPDIAAAGLADRIILTGQREDVARFYAAADLLYLASREDPFPSVVMEALAMGLPVVGHEGTGGCDDLIARHGVLIPRNTPLDAVPAIRRVLARPPEDDVDAAAARRQDIAQHHRFDRYVDDLLRLAIPDLPSLSVIVPNYDYAAHLGPRLWSIFDQVLPLREVIVLDDASTDNSLEMVSQVTAAAARRVDLQVNRVNSGSVFRQWRKGVGQADGDYVWIAEADDLAHPEFADKLLKRMQAAGSVLGFTDSRQIDSSGRTTGTSYRPHLADLGPGAFDADFDCDGADFAARFLAVKNVILNVSGAIMKRSALVEALQLTDGDLDDLQLAGDWRIYLELCLLPGARVSYLAEPLNSHRRHASSVTGKLKRDRHLTEVRMLQDLAARRLTLPDDIRRLQADHQRTCEEWLGGDAG